MSGYYTIQDCHVADFEALVGQSLDPNVLESTDSVERNIPIHDARTPESHLSDPARRLALMGEWGKILSDLSGVLVLKGAIADSAALNAASAIYEQIIETEKAAGAGGGSFRTERGERPRLELASALLARALDAGMDVEDFESALSAQASRRLP